MDKHHEVTNVSFEDDTMVVQVDGETHRINIAEHSQRLTRASEIQRQHYVVSPAGYGIHWPEIDEDLSMDGLIGIQHTPPLQKGSSRVR